MIAEENRLLDIALSPALCTIVNTPPTTYRRQNMKKLLLNHQRVQSNIHSQDDLTFIWKI